MVVNVIIISKGGGKAILASGYPDLFVDVDTILLGQTKRIEERVQKGEISRDEANREASECINQWSNGKDSLSRVLLCHNADYLRGFLFCIRGSFKNTRGELDCFIKGRPDSTCNSVDGARTDGTREFLKWSDEMVTDWKSHPGLVMKREKIVWNAARIARALSGIEMRTRGLQSLRLHSLRSNVPIRPRKHSFIGAITTNGKSKDIDVVAFQAGKKREKEVAFDSGRMRDFVTARLSFETLLGAAPSNFDTPEDGVVIEGTHTESVLWPSLFSTSLYGTLFSPEINGVVPLCPETIPFFNIATSKKFFVRPLDAALGVFRYGFPGSDVWAWVCEPISESENDPLTYENLARERIIEVRLCKLQEPAIIFECGCRLLGAFEGARSSRELYFDAMSAAVGAATKVRGPRPLGLVRELIDFRRKRVDPSGHIQIACRFSELHQHLYGMCVIENLRGKYDSNSSYHFCEGEGGIWHTVSDYAAGLSLSSKFYRENASTPKAFLRAQQNFEKLFVSFRDL